MPIVVDYSTSIRIDQYDEVVSSIRFHDEPPPGLIMHTAAATDENCIRVWDVWQTREAYEDFAENRLYPAVRAIAGEEWADSPDPEIHTLHSIVTPLGRARPESIPITMGQSP